MQATTHWYVVPANVQGPGHTASATVNQDRYVSVSIEPGVQVLAVADGAGSRPRSQLGAEYAVAAVEAAVRANVGGRHQGTVADWQDAIRKCADDCLRSFDILVEGQLRTLEALPPPGGGSSSEPKPSRNDFATTLLAVIAAPPIYGVINIGDGFLIVDRDPGGPQLVVPPPEEREHAGGTVFLTSEGRESMLTRLVLVDDNVTGLALCTDGLINGLLELTEVAHARRIHSAAATREYFKYFRNRDNPTHGLTQRLVDQEFRATSSDDKTMIVAFPPK